jgi:hypothetical protein
MPKQNTEIRSQESESRSQNREVGGDLAVENAALKARLAEMESAKTQNDHDEKLIREKMSKGLRREQARAVILRQREFDAKKAN